MQKRWVPLSISLFVLALISLPYLLAFQMSDSQSIFGGFLINPADGHSYLAKMQQGFNGAWRFVLPYTSEPGNGSYLFLFYLGLGHLARILGLPLVTLFHGTRILGSVFLLWTLYRFNSLIFKTPKFQNLGFSLSALGSGMGWAAVLGGMFTSDFWVAESYAFLSMYTNPHFVIGLALMVISLMPGRKANIVIDLLLGLALGIIQPFAVVIIIVVKLGILIVNVIQSRSFKVIFSGSGSTFPFLAFSLGGGSVLVYQYWSILTDPVLKVWNLQNITSSPGLLDLLISLSPSLVFAVFGLKAAWQEESGKLLVLWSALSLGLVFVPWNLQRRFLTGIFIPISGLAIIGISELDRNRKISIKWSVFLLFALAIPTNLIITFTGIKAALDLDQRVYIQEEIYSGILWIGANTDPSTVVLASEEIGLIIPSISGRKVIYGHPFETVDADLEQDFVNSFFFEPHEPSYFERMIEHRDLDLLLISEGTSLELQSWIIEEGLNPEYSKGNTTIYKLRD